jgi:hypothetical protein
MTPRLAALSIAEISAWISGALGFPAARVRLWRLRSRARTLRLCIERAMLCRARLAADFVLAIGKKRERMVAAQQRLVKLARLSTTGAVSRG